MIVIYGLKNCDTCRKALKWLKGEGIEHEFKDIRTDGFTDRQLENWIKTAGWETLLNRRGTTWRKLSDAERDGINEEAAKGLMRDQPALIKRPVFETKTGIIVGFKQTEVEAIKASL